ncbi:MAG TPA: hypothetical protein VMR25_02830 [Planctomycetaceae bacterium]|nr:hypothetical protein [Planctomycetaceae bacterium]
MSEADRKSARVFRQFLTCACALTLSLGLYACSFVPTRMAISWLDHWGMIQYGPVNNAFNKFYAPVCWAYDHIPVINYVGDVVDQKMRPLLP